MIKASSWTIGCWIIVMKGWAASRIPELVVSLVCYSFALIQVLLLYSMPTPLLLLLCSIFTDVMTSVYTKGKGGSGLAYDTSVACRPFTHIIETFLTYACCASLVACQTQKQRILVKGNLSHVWLIVGCMTALASMSLFLQKGLNKTDGRRL